MQSRPSSGTMAAGLCLMVTVVFFVLTISLGAIPGTGAHALLPNKIELRSVDALWARMVTPETARAVAADQQLQRNYLEAVELTTDLTRRLAERFAAVPELQEAHDSLDRYRRDLTETLGARGNNKKRAGITDGFEALLGIGGDAAGANSSGGILSGITGSITSALSGVGNTLLQDAGGAAMFLGMGLGGGAAQGLNLAPAAMVKKVTAKVAADNGMNATGLNPAIQNAAMGATASLLGSVNGSSLTALLPSTASLDLRGLALSFAQGLGNGTSSGLALSPQAIKTEPPQGNTTADVAGAFAFALTKSVAANVDLTKLTSMAGSLNVSSLTGMLGQPISQVALSFASGLGNGAASGLKLTQANLAPPPGNTVTDALGAFAFGLTDSVSSNINVSSLAGNLKTAQLPAGLSNINLAQTASSFATGLGTGAAAGLKLSSAIVGAPDPNNQDIPSVAGNFAFGLTKSVTENVNVSMLMSGGGPSLGAVTGMLDVGRVAQGAAMGLVQGAGDAVNSMGGLQALINGTAMMSTTPLPAGNMAFNDSLGGAATGFGQGLGGQGTLVGLQLLSQLNVTALVNGFASGSIGGSSSTPAPAAPAAAKGNGTAAVRRSSSSHFLPMEVVRRQAATGALNTNNSFNLTALINADTISQVGQRALDMLGCDGIGGIVLVGLGLVESGTINVGSSATKLNITLVRQILPKGVLRFTQGGNSYSIDGTVISDNIENNLLAAAGGIVVNGTPIIPFVAFLAIHIVVALLTFITLIPLVLTLDAGRNILVRLKLSHVLPKIPFWVNFLWVFVMTPLAIVALVFGSLAAGTSGHFRTVHGVLGLITVIFTIGATVVHIVARSSYPKQVCDGVVFPTRPSFKLAHALTVRVLVNQSLLMLVLPVVVSGFADLSSVSICITRVVSLEAAIGLASGLTFLYTVSSAVSSLTLMLSTREVRGKKGDGKDGEDFKDKISVVRQQSVKGQDDRAFERD